MATSQAKARSLPQRTPFYYGWVIAAIGLIAAVMSTPGQTNGFALYNDHFIADLGISRSLLSTLYTIGSLLGAFAQPMVGRLTDKRGARLMLIIISALFALACAYMGTVQNIIMLGIGFALMRGLGQGSLTIVTTITTNRWWVRRRGLIQGIIGLVTSFAMGAFPAIANGLIGTYSWRTSYYLLGAIIAAVMLPLAVIFNRSNPEDEGLQPDGLPVPAAESDASPIEDNWTLAEARRTPMFWMIGLAGAMLALLNTGLTFHLVSIFGDSGLTPTVTAAVFLPMGIVGALTRVGSGALVNKVPLRYMLAVGLLAMAAQLVIAPTISGIGMAYVYGIVTGIEGGLHATVWTIGWANYFGRKHLGEITGFVSVLLMAGSALGPLPMGLARDLLGSYRSVLFILAIIPAVMAVVAPFVPEPKRK